MHAFDCLYVVLVGAKDPWVRQFFRIHSGGRACGTASRIDVELFHYVWHWSRTGSHLMHKM